MLSPLSRPARRLLSTASAPPVTRSDVPAPSALAALLARLSLPATPANQRAALMCLTHPSYASPLAVRPVFPTKPGALSSPPSPAAPPAETDTASNALLAVLGNSLLGLFAAEHLAATFPHMPTTALKAAVTSLVGPAACVSVARELGVGVQGGADAGLAVGRGSNSAGIPVRWRRVRPPRDEDRAPRETGRSTTAGTWEEGVASATRALVGLVYQEKGLPAARDFAHAHFLSRHLDLAALLRIRNPKHVLSHVIAKHLVDAGAAAADAGRIEARVLATSAPSSPTPLFSIGLFLPSGLKLAEGSGASKSMAEHRAAVNALHSIFFARAEPHTAPAPAPAPFAADVAALDAAADGAGASADADGQARARLPTEAHGQWVFSEGALGEARGYRGSGWGGDEPLHGLR
ncbi:54S ribosomal protein L3 mitochondrial [Cryptotrichosporon argae]